MATVLMHDGTGLIVGRFENDNAEDPRIVPLSEETIQTLGPLHDKRGAPRWRWVNGAAQAVPPAERESDVERLGAAWLEWAQLKALAEAFAPELNNRPRLKAYVQNQVASRRAAVDELLRAGREDD